MDNSDKKTKPKPKKNGQPSACSTDVNAVAQLTAVENDAMPPNDNIAELEENIVNDSRGAIPKTPSWKPPQSKSKKKRGKKNKKRMTSNPFNMQVMDQELMRLNDNVNYAEGYAPAAPLIELPPQQAQHNLQSSQTNSHYGVDRQSEGSHPNHLSCLVCLRQGIHNPIYHHHDHNQRVGTATLQNSGAVEPATDPPAESSSSGNNEPVPDPNSYQVTYYRIGNFIHEGWSYTTSDGTGNRLFRFPISLAELRFAFDTLNNPAP